MDSLSQEGCWVRRWDHTYTLPWHIGLNLNLINGKPAIQASFAYWSCAVWYDPYPDDPDSEEEGQ